MKSKKSLQEFKSTIQLMSQEEFKSEYGINPAAEHGYDCDLLAFEGGSYIFFWDQVLPKYKLVVGNELYTSEETSLDEMIQTLFEWVSPHFQFPTVVASGKYPDGDSWKITWHGKNDVSIWQGSNPNSDTCGSSSRGQISALLWDWSHEPVLRKNLQALAIMDMKDEFAAGYQLDDYYNWHALNDAVIAMMRDKADEIGQDSADVRAENFIGLSFPDAFENLANWCTKYLNEISRRKSNNRPLEGIKNRIKYMRGLRELNVTHFGKHYQADRYEDDLHQLARDYMDEVRPNVRLSLDEFLNTHWLALTLEEEGIGVEILNLFNDKDL